MKCSVEEFKKNYKLVKEGKLQNVIAAKACNYTPARFSILRKRYEKEGDKLFIHGHCGKKESAPQSLTHCKADKVRRKTLINS